MRNKNKTNDWKPRNKKIDMGSKQRDSPTLSKEENQDKGTMRPKNRVENNT